MGSHKHILILALVLAICWSKQVELVEPKTTHMNDAPEEVRLAISEKINANLIGALSYSLQYLPEHSGECKIKSVRDHFKEVASRNLNPGYYSMVSSIITLKNHNMTVLIDTNLYIAAFEVVHGEFVDRMVNRTLQNPSVESVHGEEPLLVADENENYIIVISKLSYYIVNVTELKKGNLEFKEVKQSIGESFARVEIFDGILYVATRENGIKAFSISSTSSHLEQLYTIYNVNMNCEDFAIEKATKMLYLLDFERGVEIYNISNPAQKPGLYDFIDLSTFTRKNQKIEISRKTILIAFFHRSENVVAEFNYNVHEKKFSFLRYFKFKDILIDMHLMDDHLIAIGDVFVAVFPVNIHPKLIQTEMNGNIALSPIRRVIQLAGPYFIGLTYDSLILGEVQVENYDEITCALKDNSKLKKLIYKANITNCGSTQREYYDYCTYTKEVSFQKMDVVAGQGTARKLWIAVLGFCGSIFVGILSLHILRRRKEKTIKFLEAEFEKKRSMVMLPSQRLSHRVADVVVPHVPLSEDNVEPFRD